MLWGGAQTCGWGLVGPVYTGNHKVRLQERQPVFLEDSLPERSHGAKINGVQVAGRQGGLHTVALPSVSALGLVCRSAAGSAGWSCAEMTDRTEESEGFHNDPEECSCRKRKGNAEQV